MSLRSLLITVVSLCLLSPATMAQVGKVWPSERHTWIDPEFGREITQWTNHERQSWHLYFNIESFIDNENILIVSERTGRANLFRLSLATGEMTQMTDDSAFTYHVWHWPELHTAWFVNGNELCEIDTRTLERRVITTLPAKLSGLTATCDGRYVLASWNKSDSPDRFGPFAVFRIDTRTGETVQITPDLGFIVNHLQANPTDPNLMLYTWQWIYSEGARQGTIGTAPYRSWWLKVDGSDGGAVQQPFATHRTHEFWYPDGSRIGYAGGYIPGFGPRRGAFLGSCRFDGSDNFTMELPTGSSHPMIFDNGRFWIADIFNREMILTLSVVEERKIVQTEKLFRHDSSWRGQPSHPHPRISPDGRLVVIGTDRTGTPQVHSVRLDLPTP